MNKCVVILLALALIKVGYAKPQSAPMALDRVGIDLDLKKNELGKYQFAGTGTIFLEDILTSDESDSSFKTQTSKVCKIPVTVSIPGNIPGLDDALTAQLQNLIVSQGWPEGESQHFTTGFFGFTKGKAHDLKGGKYQSLFGRYTFRLAAQLKGLETKGVTGVVNDAGLGMMLPLGTDYNRLLVVDIKPVAATSPDANCEALLKNGFVIKR